MFMPSRTRRDLLGQGDTHQVCRLTLMSSDRFDDDITRGRNIQAVTVSSGARIAAIDAVATWNQCENPQEGGGIGAHVIQVHRCIVYRRSIQISHLNLEERLFVGS